MRMRYTLIVMGLIGVGFCLASCKSTEPAKTSAPTSGQTAEPARMVAVGGGR